MTDSTDLLDPADLPDPADTHETGAPEVGWLIENFDPANPFAAAIVFTDGHHDIWADLNPQALAQLHDALGTVRIAQRAAILGVPANDPAVTEPPHDTDTPAPEGTETPTPSRKMSRKTIILTAIGAIVGLCVLYSLTAGAVLI